MLAMPRAPRPARPAGSTGALPPWAAGEARAGPAPPSGMPETAPVPRVPGDAPATPHVQHARLRSRIKALLARRLKRKAEPPSPSGPPWPDSFFGP